ncbi:MAG: diaminopimelate epimerase [Gemmatimonadota bacterium]
MTESPSDPRFPAARPVAGTGLYKAHGLGNDYLVVERGRDWILTPEAVAAVCHRTRGAGSDGILWVDPGTTPFLLRGFNPDGSEFERSGNGLRILGSHLHRTGRVGDEPFQVTVGGETVGMRVRGAQGNRFDVEVEMGRARLGAGAVALDPAGLRPARGGKEARPHQVALETGSGVASLVPVSVGNPHAVVWGSPGPWSWRALDEPGAVAALERWGPALSGHGGFASGTNVQVARVETPTRILALVWERGVGRTSASGTSACAVAVSAVASGRVPPGSIEVVMEGGTLQVAVTPSLEVRLRGPVEAVWTGDMEPGLVPREARTAIGAEPDAG